MADTVIHMESRKSAVNAAIGAEIRATRSRKNITRDALSAASGIPTVQIERIENNKRDLNVSQLFAVARALELDAEDIIRRAVDASGGLAALTAEADGMSEGAPNNVTKLPRRVEDMSADELEGQRYAATRDDEMDQPEQFD
ncbi:helix-turn-helix domain-containing protein [Frondihabitans sp. VKM Ac-2883]|uniref:helix-turn-helix domain-containing protein n=1 Tax=Frondihabitans sp. VKM Ac-2883 TaxID=2783823 RepID=UPI00188BED71|nr:helix-turn-helix transcriptional regulator [Frondihabitans sp. VKM Ac-2883]MBF4574716.1 helix-turn-helix transcriptional regulator [Frondihabitans sp. VKM Ac-2883]